MEAVDWKLLKKHPPPLLSQQGRLLSQTYVLWEGRHLSSSSLLYAVFSINVDLMLAVLPGSGPRELCYWWLVCNCSLLFQISLFEGFFKGIFKLPFFSQVTTCLWQRLFEPDNSKISRPCRTFIAVHVFGCTLYEICKVWFHVRSKNWQLPTFPVNSSHDFRFESQRWLHSVM